MVFPCKKRSAAEVFRPASIQKQQLAPNAQEPRPARTPPSTFLFLLLNLSNSPTPEASKSLSTIYSTTIQQPRPIGYFITVAMLISGARQTARAVGPRRRRAQWPSYRGGRPDLSTRFVRKSSRDAEESSQAKKRRFISANVASKPH